MLPTAFFVSTAERLKNKIVVGNNEWGQLKITEIC